MSALLPKASSRSSGGIRLSRRVRLSARFDEAARRSLALRDHHVPAEACERERARVVGEDDAKLRESAEVLEDEAFPAAKRPADHAVPGMIPKDSVSVRQDEKLIADLRGRQAWSFGAVRHLGDRPPAGRGSNSLLVDEEDHTQDHGQREQEVAARRNRRSVFAAACIVVRQSSRIAAAIPILSGAGHRPSVLLHFSRSARIVAIAGGSGMPANSRKRVGSSSIQRVA